MREAGMGTIVSMGYQLPTGFGDHLLHDTLHDVQFVTTDDDLLALIQRTEGFQLGLDARPQPDDTDHQSVDPHREHMYSRILRNAFCVDAHGAVADGSNVSLHINAAPRGDLVTAYTNARGREVARVGVCLEADEVRPEHAVQDLLAARETPEHLGTREGRVDEETDSGIRQCLTEQRRDEEKVVVVDPDQVSGPVDLRHAPSESRVHSSVRRPVGVCGSILGCDVLP